MTDAERAEKRRAYQREYYKAHPRKTVTSSEVKARWNSKTYKQYSISFRKDTDVDVIERIEAERAKGLSASEAIKNLIRG